MRTKTTCEICGIDHGVITEPFPVIDNNGQQAEVWVHRDCVEALPTIWAVRRPDGTIEELEETTTTH